MARHSTMPGGIGLFVTVFTGAASAQQTQPSEVVWHCGTREVLLDFVVRDKLVQ